MAKHVRAIIGTEISDLKAGRLTGSHCFENSKYISEQLIKEAIFNNDKNAEKEIKDALFRCLKKSYTENKSNF